MILVDTNVWIDFFKNRQKSIQLVTLLAEKRVVSHPWIVGEMSVGNLGSFRQEILSSLRVLPQVEVYAPDEIFTFIEKEKLFGKGLSFVDVQLLYASIKSKCSLWTHDVCLQKAAQYFGVE